MLTSYSRYVLRRYTLGHQNRISQNVLIRNRCYHELSYAESGSPRTSLQYRNANPTDEASWIDRWDGVTRWVRVEMIAAPWNPADALAVQGVYPSPWDVEGKDGAALAASIRRSVYESDQTVVGSEGWGRVVDVYPHQKERTDAAAVEIGDYVVPGISGLGTFRSALWAPETHWIRLERGQELQDALGPFLPAALFQTGGTAWRMLHDFGALHPGGDVVVQNAGNSAVGFMVSQIASEILKVPCISLVRTGNRTPEQLQKLQGYLQERGKASLVLNEESITKETVADVYNSLSQLNASPLNVRLALNAVGGSSVDKLLLLLHNHGTVVTYGGMSREPITVDTSQFIFRNMHLAGYWHSRWMVDQHRRAHGDTAQSKVQDARVTMMNALVDAVLDQRLECPPVQSVALPEFQTAFAPPSELPTIRQKVVFDCRENTSSSV